MSINNYKNWKSEDLEAWLRTEPHLDSEFLHLPDWHEPYKHHVMHEWERPLMKVDAEQICSKGGSILNIGYGMGIIDGYIKDHKPTKHTIIEIHPKIAAMAVEAGHENVLVGDWLDVVKDLDEQFDAIYFDTFCFDGRPDWGIFTAHHVDKLLKPGGIFSYFNSGAANKQGVAGLCEALGWQKQIKTVEYTQDGKTVKQYDSIIWHKSAK